MLNLLLITEKDRSHYVFIKDFNRLMFLKTKHKNKKDFCMPWTQQKWTQQISKKYFNKILIMTNEDEKFIIIHKFVGYVKKS